MKYDIRNRFFIKVQFTAEIDCADDADIGTKTGLAVLWAVKNGTDLTGADLTGAYLYGADLSRAYLADANLADANLIGANLIGANLTGADLTGADLYGTNLADANLADANLIGANLTGTNLAGADLIGANLTDAYLYGADLSRAYLADANLAGANLNGANLAGADLADANLAGANLNGANLAGANLTGANLAGQELTIARNRILPDGDIIGWKKCIDGVIVKLLIPASAKRSHAFGRKCRAEYADVLEVIGAEVFGTTLSHGPKTEYRVGTRVTPDSFDEDWRNECSNGIHFFITRIEAENYSEVRKMR